jgi:hypothetical protein
MREGDYIRHRAAESWGVGRVLSVSGEDLHVQFDHAVMKLKLAIALPHLEKLTAAEVRDLPEAAPSPPRRVRKTRAPQRAPSVRGRAT